MALAQEMLKCELHGGFYDNPRQMPQCNHVFCLNCIRELPQSDPGYIECPICRNQQELPPRGIAGLRPDITTAKFIKNLSCDDCELIKNTVYECATCKRKHCDDCKNTHTNPQRCGMAQKVREMKEVARSPGFEDKVQQTGSFLNGLGADIDQYRTYINAKIENELQLLRELKRMANENLDAIQDKRKERMKRIALIVDIQRQLHEYTEIIREGNTRKMKNHEPNIERMHKILTNGDLLKTEDVFELHRQYEQCLDQSQRPLFDYADRRVVRVDRGPEASLNEPHDLCTDPIDDSLYVCDRTSITCYKWSNIDNLVLSQRWNTNGPTLCHITARREKLVIEINSNLLRLDGTKFSARLILRESEKLRSMTSYKDRECSTIYIASSQHIYRFQLEKGYHKSDGTIQFPPTEVNVNVALNGISDMDMDTHGLLFVVATEDNAVYAIKPATAEVVGCVHMAGVTPLNRPLSVSIDLHGWILVSDQGNTCVQVYKPDLIHYTSISAISTPFFLPKRVRVDRYKRVCVLDTQREKLTCF